MRRADIFLILLFVLQLVFYNLILTNLKFFFVSLGFSASNLNHLISLLYAMVFILIFVNLFRLYQVYKTDKNEDAEKRVGQVISGSLMVLALNFVITALSSRLP